MFWVWGIQQCSHLCQKASQHCLGMRRTRKCCSLFDATVAIESQKDNRLMQMGTEMYLHQHVP